MSTNITINVSNNQLVSNNKEQQLANRQAFIEAQQLKDIEKLARNEKEEQEIKKEPLRARDGAVPEYEVVPETSAQRDETAIGLGWVYESYEDVLEQTYVDKNRFRVAVGSGDGSSWKYVDLEVDVPLNARDRILESGSAGVYTATVLRNNFTNYLECFGTQAPETIIREYEYDHIFNPGPTLYGTFVIPISDNEALLVGSACLRWLVYKRVVISSQSFSVSAPYVYGTTTLGQRIIIDQSTFGEKTIIDSGGNPTGGTIEASCFYSATTSGNFDNLFNPPPWEIIDHKVSRQNFAFLITAKKVKQISVSNNLEDLLEEIFPTPEPVQIGNNFGWSVSFWPDTDYSAAGVGFNVSNLWGSVIEGAPTIFDILENENNFDLYRNATDAASDYIANIPRYSPDALLDPGDPLDKEISSIYSAFYFGARLTSRPLVPGPPPSIVAVFADISEYAYLTPSQREESHFYEYASTAIKDIVSKMPANPALAFMEIRNPADGVSQLQTGANVKWQPTTGFNRKKISVALKPGRLLPPALYSIDLTPHPMIRKQRTFQAPSFVSGAGTPYSTFRLSTVIWTAWRRRWQFKLRELGITLIPSDD